MRFVASNKKVLEMVCKKCGCIARTVVPRDRVLLAGAEDRATLESDLSADAGHIRMGRALCSALSAAHPVCRKAINSSFALERVGPLRGRHCRHPRALTPVCLTSSFAQTLLHALDFSFQSGWIKRLILGPQLLFLSFANQL